MTKCFHRSIIKHRTSGVFFRKIINLIPRKIKISVKKFLRVIRLNNIFHPIIFLSVSDFVLPPFKDKPTTQQLIAFSRAADIENGLRKDKSFSYWERRLSEIIDNRQLEESRIPGRFYELVKIFDRFGMNPALSYVQAGINPASINDGTHRLGYFIEKYKYNKHFRKMIFLYVTLKIIQPAY